MKKQVLLFIVIAVVALLVLIFLPSRMFSNMVIEEIIEAEQEVPADTSNRLM